ncbi:MAG TPA: matrixin family metalloprotease [Gemmataceae bacterium]|jgi:hypothetical protein|nr:matrixin family metalloprotease [Gemmataceae bacterium]
MKPQKKRLGIELLEGRDVPASFGVAWTDSRHLTLSFVPDGTNAYGEVSDLTTKLDAMMPRNVWRSTILRAAQAWAQGANINFGLVGDGGQDFGVAGANQGDGRFGDIRVGGLAMAGDALGEGVPPDPVLSGTLSGDVFFNTSHTFTSKELYSVALHEIGHALGMAPSVKRNSVMFNQFRGNNHLSGGDLVALRSLYGYRGPDAAEGPRGNGAFTRATPVEVPSSFKGKTPLITYGELYSRTDVDYIAFKNLVGYAGQVTLRVQTAGVSLMTPRLKVYDAQHKLVGEVLGTNPEGDSIQFTIPQTVDGATYFLRIDAAPKAVARIGRYGVAITFDGIKQDDSGGLTLAQILAGPYDAIKSSDLLDLFEHPDLALYNQDDGSDDHGGGADDLPGRTGPLALARFTATGSLTNATDVDFYRIRSGQASSGLAVTLVATVRTLGPNGVAPIVEVQDQNGNVLPIEILANGNGTYTVQAKGIQPETEYLLKVSGGSTGNYALDAAFRGQPVVLQTFASGSVSSGQPASYKLYVARTQLFGFTLAATGPAGAAVNVTIKDSQGVSVFTLTALAGQTISGLSAFLAPGEYTVAVTSVGAADPVTFALKGDVVSDPMGPRPDNTKLAPLYPDPNNPGGYLYPNGTPTLIPFLWVLL